MRKFIASLTVAVQWRSPLRLSSRWEVIGGQNNLAMQVACNSHMGV